MIYSFYGMLILLLSLALLTGAVLLMWVVFRDATDEIPPSEQLPLPFVPLQIVPAQEKEVEPNAAFRGFHEPDHFYSPYSPFSPYSSDRG